MYKCTKCDKEFETPYIKRISLESYYGVGCDFDNHNYTDMEICPYCEDEDIEEILEKVND